MSGLSILLRKELVESWRTYRLPIVGGLFLFVGLTSPVLAKYLPEIIKAAAGDQFPDIAIPTPVATDAVNQLWKNLGQFGAFAAIVLAMGSVATERERGTAAFVLTKTESRDGFLAAKALAIGLVLALAVALAVIVGWIYTAILFEPLPVAGWIGLAVLAWLYLAAWAAITFLGSTVTGSVAAAAGIGFAAFLGLSVVAAVPNLGRFLPGGLADPAIRLASGLPVEPADALVPAIATAILIGVALLASAVAFRRQEL